MIVIMLIVMMMFKSKTIQDKEIRKYETQEIQVKHNWSSTPGSCSGQAVLRLPAGHCTADNLVVIIIILIIMMMIMMIMVTMMITVIMLTIMIMR